MSTLTFCDFCHQREGDGAGAIVRLSLRSDSSSSYYFGVFDKTGGVGEQYDLHETYCLPSKLRVLLEGAIERQHRRPPA